MSSRMELRIAVAAAVLLLIAAGFGIQHFLWGIDHAERGDAAVSPDGVYVAQPFALSEGDIRPYGDGVYVRRPFIPRAWSKIVFAAYCAPDPRVTWRSSRELVVYCDVKEKTPVVLESISGITVIHIDG